MLDKLNKSVEGSVAMNTQLKSKIRRKMKDLVDEKKKKRQYKVGKQRGSLFI